MTLEQIAYILSPSHTIFMKLWYVIQVVIKYVFADF